MSQRSTSLIALAAASAEWAIRRFVGEPVGSTRRGAVARRDVSGIRRLTRGGPDVLAVA